MRLGRVVPGRQPVKVLQLKHCAESLHAMPVYIIHIHVYIYVAVLCRNPAEYFNHIAVFKAPYRCTPPLMQVQTKQYDRNMQRNNLHFLHRTVTYALHKLVIDEASSKGCSTIVKM